MSTSRVSGSVPRAVRSELNSHRTHIQLRNLPPTAIPSDIWRAVIRSKLKGVADVQIDYQRFLPSGRAYLTLTHPDFLQTNLAALQNVSISGIQMEAYSAPPPPSALPARNRGVKGRSEAMDRGLITGNGPSGGVSGSGKNVVIWGLPGKLSPEGLKAHLKGFRQAGSQGGVQEVVQIEKPGKKFSLVSRYLVRLSSAPEAHRLVRLMHMSCFEPDRPGKKYELRARVIY